jgi:hypothetical protein
MRARPRHRHAADEGDEIAAQYGQIILPLRWRWPSSSYPLAALGRFWLGQLGAGELRGERARFRLYALRALKAKLGELACSDARRRIATARKTRSQPLGILTPHRTPPLSRRGQIRRSTRRDFVPWRFSAAGHQSERRVA